VNIQGDETVYFHPGNIDLAIEPLLKDKDLNVATLAVEFNEPDDPNKVKVIFDKNNFAIYFSRSAIPFNRDGKKINIISILDYYMFSRIKIFY